MGNSSKKQPARLFEAQCTEAACKVVSLEVLVATGFEITQCEENATGRCARIHLCPKMANSRSSRDSLTCLEQCFALRTKVDHRVRDLRVIGDLGAAKALLPGQSNAFAQALMRTDHPSTRVLGIAEAAERGRLVFG